MTSGPWSFLLVLALGFAAGILSGMFGIGGGLVIVPALTVGAMANVIYNVTQVSLRQAITPERLQGRMNSVMRFIVWGTLPLGALVGGILASRIGVRETVIVGGIGCCLPFLPVLFSPVRGIKEMPQPVEDRAAAVLGPLVADAGPVPVERIGS